MTMLREMKDQPLFPVLPDGPFIAHTVVPISARAYAT